MRASGALQLVAEPPLHHRIPPRARQILQPAASRPFSSPIMRPRVPRMRTHISYLRPAAFKAATRPLGLGPETRGRTTSSV